MFVKINPRNFQVSEEVIKNILRVSPATIGHYLEYGAMSSKIKPVYEGVKIAGPAITVRTPSMDSTICHYMMEIAKPGDIIVIDRCGEYEYASVGEMVALCAKARKVAGIIVDGAITDKHEIEEMQMPVFARGISVSCTRLLGISGEINITINCGGIVVNPGDIIFADDNGVLSIPPYKVEELTKKALDAENKEVDFRKKIKEGILLGDLSGASNIIRESMKK